MCCDLTDAGCIGETVFEAAKVSLAGAVAAVRRRGRGAVPQIVRQRRTATATAAATVLTAAAAQQTVLGVLLCHHTRKQTCSAVQR